MGLLILAALILLIPAQQPQTGDPDEADLIVPKFTWSKYRQNNDLIHSVQDPGLVRPHPCGDDGPDGKWKVFDVLAGSEEMCLPQRRKGAKKTFRNAAALCAFARLRERSSPCVGSHRRAVTGRRRPCLRRR